MTKQHAATAGASGTTDSTEQKAVCTVFNEELCYNLGTNVIFIFMKMETRVQALELQIHKEKEEAKELLLRQRQVYLQNMKFTLFITT